MYHFVSNRCPFLEILKMWDKKWSKHLLQPHHLVTKDVLGKTLEYFLLAPAIENRWLWLLQNTQQKVWAKEQYQNSIMQFFP